MGGRLIAERGSLVGAALGTLALTMGIEALSDPHNLNIFEKAALVGAAIESLVTIANWRHGISKSKHNSSGQSWKLPDALIEEAKAEAAYERDRAARRARYTPISTSQATEVGFIPETRRANQLGPGKLAQWVKDIRDHVRRIKPNQHKYKKVIEGQIASCWNYNGHILIKLHIKDENGKQPSCFLPDGSNRDVVEKFLNELDLLWNGSMDPIRMINSFRTFASTIENTEFKKGKK